MNEASSKYVDQIAVEKLLTEKLNKVHHYPLNNALQTDYDLDSLDKINYHNINIKLSNDYEDKKIYRFSSVITTGYKENDEVKIFQFPAKSEKLLGNLIFVHGLYEDNLSIYNIFISLLNKSGINVYLFILPFHYNRKPKESLFSGEYFWSGNIDRSILAFTQSLFDISIFYRSLKHEYNLITLLAGFSMGGGISLSLASYLKLDGLFVINPVSNITSLIWNSKLFSSIKKDFETVGLDFNNVKSKFKKFEPLDINDIETPEEKVSIGYSLYDQVNDIENYQLLINRWNMKNIHKYKAGHLNILRVPKIANDIIKIFQS